MKKHYPNLLVCLIIVTFITNKLCSQNSPPTFTSTPITSVNSNDIYNYIITTSDPNGDQVVVTAPTIPSWLSLSLDNVTTVAGSSVANFQDGPVSTALFNNISSVTIDQNNNIYVTDVNRIRKISGGMVSTIAGSSWGYVDGAGNVAKFTAPVGLVTNNTNLYVSDGGDVAHGGNNRIRKIDLTTNTVSTFAGSGVRGFADGSGMSAQFNGPSGLDVSTSGFLFIADARNNRIRKVSLTTNDVSTLAGSGIQGFADGSANTAKFKLPSDVALKSDGNLYVADVGNQKIRVVDTNNGNVTTLATSTYSGEIVMGLSNQLLYIVNNGVKQIDLATGSVSTVAGTGVQGYLDGPGSSAQFFAIRGLAISSDSNNNNSPFIIVADGTEVRKISIGLGLVGTPPGPGSYPVVLNANDGKGGSINQNFTITVNATLGIDKNIIKDFALYPNPVEDILNIETQENINNIKIFNPLGQQIVNKNANTNKISVNINYLPKGIYFVIVNTDKTIESVEIMKQ